MSKTNWFKIPNSNADCIIDLAELNCVKRTQIQGCWRLELSFKNGESQSVGFSKCGSEAAIKSKSALDDIFNECLKKEEK